MNVKIQGSGNGTYANTGSCVAVTNYLQHEDLERMKKGEEVQPFFNQFRDYVSAREVTFKIDNNKAKLSRTDAKFYVITVSPSEKELRCMGRTPQECAEALRRYIRQDVMRNYAEGFGKGLKSDDVEYYAKIHFNRDGESDSDMHAHIIVSRKDRSNTRKLSPKTNHTGKKNCGNVKGGFDRTDFFRKCESSFDRRMGFDREPEESFDYLNAVKNGNPIVIGTTGFTPEQKAELDAIAQNGRVFWSPNMSVGVNVLLELLPELVQMLGPDYDLEMVELHHNRKKDSPSGTALRLAESLASARDWDLKDVACYHREGIIGERPKKEIGVQAIRGGDVVGVHTVYFMGPGERIEVTHHAHSRENFAQGALRAASWLPGQPSGKVYAMGDILKSRLK